MKKKTLLMSILTVVMCLSLTIGGTFALFTSESELDIAVNSGKVVISATIDQNSVETKELYDTDYTAGANNMYEGVATFTNEGLTLEKFVPGDGIKFNIVVKNDSDVTVKYRTIIECIEDNGLFSGLDVNIGNIENYNGNKYVANWATLEVGSADIIVPVAIELPENAGNEYQEKSCKINYFVEAVQGNAKTENVSNSVAVDGNATNSVTFGTNGADSPIVEVSKEALNEIAPDANGEIAFMHSEPVIEGKTVSFRTMEIVDGAGNVIDLAGNTGLIKVTFSVKGSSLKVGDTVFVYHDGEHIATTTVDADYNVSYETTHFCEVAVSTKILSDTIKVSSYEEFNKALAGVTEDTTIVLNADLTFTKQLFLNKGVKLTLDLNGYDIKADLPNNELIQLQKVKGNELVITSSKPDAKIDLGGKALVLAYADVTVENVEIVVDEIKSSSYQTIKMQNGALAVKNVKFSVHFLGTSLITGASSIAIEDTALCIDAFKTNSGAIISGNKATQVAIKNITGNVILDPTYTQYFIAFNNDNVVIENNKLVAIDADGYCYSIEPVTQINTNDKIGFIKGALLLKDTQAIKDAFVAGGEIAIGTKIVAEDFGFVNFGANTVVDFKGNVISRETASVNPLLVNTTEKVVFKNGVFESVKGSAVIATRKEGANIEVNDSVFKNFANPSTGNCGIQVYASNVTMVFNNCEFFNMPIETNSSYPENIKLVFNNCKFNWTGDNCPGIIKLANNVKTTIDLNNCEFNYTTTSQYTSRKNFISSTRPGETTVNINGLKVVGNRANGSVWELIYSSNNAITINKSGECSYTFNGEAVDFDTYL